MNVNKMILLQISNLAFGRLICVEIFVIHSFSPVAILLVPSSRQDQFCISSKFDEKMLGEGENFGNVPLVM